MNHSQTQFWSVPSAELLQQLQTTPQGLRRDEIQERLLRYGSNLLRPKKKSDMLTLLIAQFKSPIILILIFAAGLSFFLRDPIDAVIILVIVFISGFLGFWRERVAVNAVEKLLAIVQIKATVLRNGNTLEVPIEEIVPGDIVFIQASDVIPGDCLVLESKDLFVDEAALTGETYPVEKTDWHFATGHTAQPADKLALYGNPCGERERQGSGRPDREGDRVWKRFRTTETRTP